MKLAIVARLENYEQEKPFNKKYYLNDFYKEIFDELDVLLIPIISEKNLDEICNICDGLILTGSPNDVHPKYYNDDPIENKKYDGFDEYNLVKNIVKMFSEKNKPILGICAGIQELNVIFGGSLNQLIQNHNLRDESEHLVKITEGSFLDKVYNKKYINVNSYHSQSIKELAHGFKITALSEDGIIEGIEKDNIIAVQWHPETVYDIKFFKTFIDIFF